MRRIIVALIFSGLFIGLRPIVEAQLVARTATITDSDSQTWNNGTCKISVYNSSGQGSYYNGTQIPSQYACAIDGNGLLTATLYTTSTLTPSSSQYTFTICSNTSASCSTFNSPVTVTDLSSTLSALVTVPRFRYNPAGLNYGYVDAEILSPGQDNSYYNNKANTFRFYNVGTSTWATGGGGSTACTGTAGQLYMAGSTTGSCVPSSFTDNGSNISTAEGVQASAFQASDGAGSHSQLSTFSQDTYLVAQGKDTGSFPAVNIEAQNSDNSDRFLYITCTIAQCVINTTINTPGAVVGLITNNSTTSSVNCSTSGTAVFSQPEAGSSSKTVVIVLAACVGTASYTYPTAYSSAPTAIGTLASIAGTPSTTAVTITGTTSTGTIELIGR